MSDSHKVAKSWVTATCREVFHPNAAHCGPHFSKVFRQVFWQSIKLYTPFFLALNLLNGRKLNTIESWKKLLKSVLRGSLFLSIDGPGTILLCCSARNLLGYHSRLGVWLSCFVACFLGISVEDPNRQRELTVYTASVAADSLFRMLVSRGFLKPIKHGRALIFVAGMALSSWLYSRGRTTAGTHTTSMRWIAGNRATAQDEPVLFTASLDRSLLPLVGQSPNSLKKSEHKDWIYVANGFIRGIMAGAGLRFIGMILSRRFTAKAFIDKLQFSSFLGLLVGLYRLVIVCTSKPGDQLSTSASLLAGTVSGLSAFFSPSIELAMFAAAKTVDALIRPPLVDPSAPEGQPPRRSFRQRMGQKSTQLVKLTFAFSCALVYYCVIFENHNVRPSYMKFLLTTSAGHLKQMPRISKLMCKELGTPNLTPPGAFD